jgi:hypothetical protein
MMKIETTDIEVKDYVKKLVNVVAKTMVDSFENLTIEDVNMFKLGYNKAVDDTIKAIKEEYAFTILEEEKIDEIAEQLKGAKQNEDFKQEEI